MTTDEKLDRLQADVQQIGLSLIAVVDLLRSTLKRPPRTRPQKITATGRVTHPADLGPAIASLSNEARDHMYTLLGGRPPTADDIAQAADWWNEQPRRVA